MPAVRLTINLGVRDALRLGLDPAAALDGATAEASDRAAREIEANGWGVRLPDSGAAAEPETEATAAPSKARRPKAAKPEPTETEPEQ